jgi:quercetin dioxygenase-like cupin family protein
MTMSHEPSVVRAADLPTYEPAPGATLQMLTGEEHGLGVCLILAAYPPGVGPGPHRHPTGSAIHVVEGHGMFTVDDQELPAVAGDVVVIPPNAWHAFRNDGEGWLRVVGVDEGARHDVEFPDTDS